MTRGAAWQALKAGLAKEELLLARLSQETQRAATVRASEEVAHLNQRVSELQTSLSQALSW